MLPEQSRLQHTSSQEGNPWMQVLVKIYITLRPLSTGTVLNTNNRTREQSLCKPTPPTPTPHIPQLTALLLPSSTTLTRTLLGPHAAHSSALIDFWISCCHESSASLLAKVLPFHPLATRGQASLNSSKMGPHLPAHVNIQHYDEVAKEVGHNGWPILRAPAQEETLQVLDRGPGPE